MKSEIEDKHWEGIEETTGMTKEQFQKVLNKEEEIKKFMEEIEEYMIASKRVMSNLNFDIHLFMMWRILNGN